MGYWPSPDGARIAYTDDLGDEIGASQGAFDLRVFTRSDHSIHKMASRIPMDMGTAVCWSPDGTRLALRTAGPGLKGDCLVVAVAGGETINLTEKLPQNFGDPYVPPCWSDDGRTIYCVSGGHLWAIPADGGASARVSRGGTGRHITDIVPHGHGRAWSTDGGRSVVVASRENDTLRAGFEWKIDLGSGRRSTLLIDDKMYGEVVVALDGSRVVFWSPRTRAHPPDLWAAGAEFREPRRVSHANPRLDGYRFGTSRLIHWRSVDGLALCGALLLPSGYETGTGAIRSS